MAWIETVPEDEATDSLQEAYHHIAGPEGKVAHILILLANSERVLKWGRR